MEWRCEWCGKPHADDDPPCDNCGHGEFERAVVPAGPEGGGGPLVWVCADCGRGHPRNNPPCSRCGGMDLEKQRQDDVPAEPLEDAGDDGGRSLRDLWSGGDEEPEPQVMAVWACTECGRAHQRNNPPCNACGATSFRREQRRYDAEGDYERVDDEPAPASKEDARDGPDDEVADTMTGWVCTECGRSHPRNNPPCSRCGNMHLEQREQRFDAVDASGGGWLDAVDARVALGFVGAALLLVLLAGPALGLFTLPGTGPPTVEDVPGEDERVGGVALSDVERSFVTTLGERRTAMDTGDLAWNDRLAAVAAYNNRRVVKAAYADGSVPSEGELDDAFPDVEACSGRITVRNYGTARTVDGTAAGEFGSADGMAAALVDAYLESSDGQPMEAEGGLGAVDVHVAPDGRVFVTVVAC